MTTPNNNSSSSSSSSSSSGSSGSDAMDEIREKEKEKAKEKQKHLEENSDEPSSTEEVVKQSHLMQLAELKFLYSLQKSSLVQEQILAIVKEKNMGPYYAYLNKTFGWKEDPVLSATLSESNAKELKELEDKIVDAEKNFGETEVRDANLAKADLFARIGDHEKALPQYNSTLAKTIGSGQKIDIAFSILRTALFVGDAELVKTNIDKAKSLVDDGGDWERRNRLKVYQAMYFLLVRDFKEAAKLFLDSIATFTCYELYPYNTFVFYTVLTSMVALDRVTLKEKVIPAPEILQVIHEIPRLHSFLHSLYKCHYRQFFTDLTNIMDVVAVDRFLAPHARFLLREIRVVVYAQFLESYRSVTLVSMADAFGITPLFLDRDLSLFISTGRVNAKIDKVGGIVETNRPDARNAQYQAALTQGDLLLNRIQKLSRVITY